MCTLRQAQSYLAEIDTVGLLFSDDVDEACQNKMLVCNLVHLKLAKMITIKDRRNTEECEAKLASKIVFNGQEVERR